MSPFNNSTIAAVSVAPPPTSQPNQPTHRGKLPAHVDLDHLRCVERRARQEIEEIEQNARTAARTLYPMERLPRAESNARSVKRTRHWRSQSEREIKERINIKFQRNRHLDQLLQQIRERHRRITQDIAHVEALPDVEPDLVQFDEVTPDELMSGIIANLEADLQSPGATTTEQFLPNPDFDAAFAAITNPFIESNPFAELPDPANHCLPDCEPILNPSFLMPSQSTEEFDHTFLPDEHV